MRARFIIPVMLLSALAVLPSCSATKGMSAKETEAEYQRRFEVLMRNGGIMLHYEPLETVQGVENWRPLETATRPTIHREALEAATDYAAANNSTAFIVWRNGRIEAEQYFDDVTATTPLVSKSLSKPLTAIVVGRAIQLGKIKSLEQPVADFIEEWQDGPKAEVRVRHLLDMTSGFMRQTYSQDPDHPVNRVYIAPNHDYHLIHNYPLTHTPGTEYGYNNATAEMVAILIERATGMRYSDFIGQEVLARIGAQGGDIWVDREGGLAHSGCCMLLPAESWLRLAILLMNDGSAEGQRLLPEGYVKAMVTPTDQNPYYGLGVWVAGEYTERRGFAGVGAGGPQVLHSEPYVDPELVLFDGNNNQTVFMSFAQQTIVLRMGNRPPKSPEWDNSVLPNLILRGIKSGGKYVSMGSSFASGPGVTQVVEGSPRRCGRSQDNYAQQVSQVLNLTLVDVSCSGATTEHILGAWNELPAQIDAVDADVELVTVLIGGNDLGYIGNLMLASCLHHEKTSDDPDKKTCWKPGPSVTEDDFRATEARMTQIATAVKNKAPEAVLVFVDYATVLPPEGSCESTPMSLGVADNARTVATRLREMTERVALNSGAIYLKASQLTEEHHVCAQESWMRGYPSAAWTFAEMPYHPTLPAMSAIARALVKALTNDGSQ